MQLGATTAIGMITIIGTRDPGGLRMTAIGSSTITPSGTKARLAGWIEHVRKS
ncbi:MAG: hypothetical protein QOK29_2651 [Rhodospirillaceae bacterium]|nr:hypothetical protein [Rhodospirillaceae bacterium]